MKHPLLPSGLPAQIKIGRGRTHLAHGKEDRKRLLLKARKQRYRARHPGFDSDIARLRAWGAANPERKRQATRDWNRRNYRPRKRQRT